jgi:hypothetical protein
LEHARYNRSLRLFETEPCEIEFDPGVEAPVKSIALRLPREMLNDAGSEANHHLDLLALVVRRLRVKVRDPHQK